MWNHYAVCEEAAKRDLPQEFISCQLREQRMARAADLDNHKGSAIIHCSMEKDLPIRLIQKEIHHIISIIDQRVRVA